MLRPKVTVSAKELNSQRLKTGETFESSVFDDGDLVVVQRPETEKNRINGKTIFGPKLDHYRTFSDPFRLIPKQFVFFLTATLCV